RLISTYEETVRAANRRLEDDVRVPYGELVQIYADHFQSAQSLMLELPTNTMPPFGGGLVLSRASNAAISFSQRVGFNSAACNPPATAQALNRSRQNRPNMTLLGNDTLDY
ncbi:MAG: hypothetical protein ACXW3Z_14495, partial [Limisphaerales bacterium]